MRGALLSTGSTPYLFADLCQELDTSTHRRRRRCAPGNRINVFSVPRESAERACGALTCCRLL